MVGETILVTGGAGFIGSHLVSELLRQAKRVVCFDNLTYAAVAPQIASPNFRLVVGDICDHPAILKTLSETCPQAVIHLAAETHVDRSIDGPGCFAATNALGTQVLLDACLRFWKGLPEQSQATFRFVNISTDEVYGSLPSGACDESAALNPNSPYAASKAAAEHFVRAYHQTFQLPTVTLRSTNNFGPRQFPEKLIPLMLLNAMKGRRLPVYGDGSQRRCWLYVADHVQAIISALKFALPGSVYNLGSRHERSNIEVVHAVCSALQRIEPKFSGSAKLIEHVVDRPGHDFRYCVDDSRARADFGWSQLVSFDQAIQGTVEWYLANQDWVAAVASKSHYDLDRIGLGK